jgi:hypothetical protein
MAVPAFGRYCARKGGFCAFSAPALFTTQVGTILSSTGSSLDSKSNAARLRPRKTAPSVPFLAFLIKKIHFPACKKIGDVA